MPTATLPDAATPVKTQTNKSVGIWHEHIAGGFRSVTVLQLTMAWWCYKQRHVDLLGLRAYFALHEMAERRRWTDSTRLLYTLDELHKLVGGSGGSFLRKAVKRLERCGLARVRQRSIDFARVPAELRVDDVASLWAMHAKVKNGKRTCPVPRRLLRDLAAGMPTGAIATAIAALIRCVFWHRDRGYRSDGRCKASWVADVFGMARATAQRGRAELRARGWITLHDSPQWTKNRYGGLIELHLDGPKVREYMLR